MLRRPALTNLSGIGPVPVCYPVPLILGLQAIRLLALIMNRWILLVTGRLSLLSGVKCLQLVLRLDSRMLMPPLSRALHSVDACVLEFVTLPD